MCLSVAASASVIVSDLQGRCSVSVLRRSRQIYTDPDSGARLTTEMSTSPAFASRHAIATVRGTLRGLMLRKPYWVGR